MSNQYGNPAITKSRNSDLILCIDPAELNSSGHLNHTDMVTNLHATAATSNNEERIEVGRDPWGRIALIDRSEGNDVGSNYDGGHTTSVYSVTNTSKYRFTYFFRVDNKGSNGTLYFGLYGYNASTQNIGVFSPSGTGTANTNPYFSYPGHNLSKWEVGRWYMFVAYVHSEGSTNVSDDTAGYYDMTTGAKVTGVSVGNINYNGVWQNATTQTRARQYLYYSTDPDVGMSWLIPRIDKIDGNEPSITEMLNSPQDRLSNLAVGDGRMFYPRGGGTGMEHTYKSTSLDGSSYLDLGTDKDFKTTGGWTISTWIKYNTVPAGYTDNQNSPGNFIGAESISYSSWYWSAFNNKLALWDKGGGAWYYGSTTLSANRWYYATLVSDSNNVSYYCYLNGEDDMSSGWSSRNGSWQNYPGLRIRYIGQGNGSNPRRVDGNIASTHVWSRALTAAEIKQNFNQQRARFGV